MTASQKVALGWVRPNVNFIDMISDNEQLIRERVMELRKRISNGREYGAEFFRNKREMDRLCACIDLINNSKKG